MDMLKVMIKRTAPPGKEKTLLDLIAQLRMMASGQSGYISGETLLDTAHPGEFLVISIWDKEADWKKWNANEQRQQLQEKIDALIGPTTTYSTYQYPHHLHTV
jgi:heme-degrading monooxygenase HmoA